MERLLVTGVNFPLGGNLALALANRFSVLGAYGRQAVEASGLQTARCEPHDIDSFEQLVQWWQPQWIIHCGPLAASSWESGPRASVAEHEVRFVGALPRSAGTARLTVISSDAVFAGPYMFHEETSPGISHAPRATQVRSMEQALAATGALMVRTHAFGWCPVAEHADFAQRTYEQLSSGGLVEADGRRHATPILATDLAELLHRAYELRCHGLCHLSGAERTSPWGFASELASALGVACRQEPSAANWSSTAEAGDETSLSSKRMRRVLERVTPMLHESINRFVSQAHDGWRDRWHVSEEAVAMSEAAA